jgi:ferredoxin-type protein NapF
MVQAQQSLSRREFLRGRFGGSPTRSSPPWAVEQFFAACTRCDACAESCPSGIIVRGSGGFPEVDFSRGECTLCGDCASACRDGALQRGTDTMPWSIKAHIGPACLARNEVVCRSCGDSCAPHAIHFRPRSGGAYLPEIDAAVCNGCGACFSSCPANAIAMHADAEPTAERTL